MFDPSVGVERCEVVLIGSREYFERRAIGAVTMTTHDDSADQHDVAHGHGQHQSGGVEGLTDTAHVTRHEEHGSADGAHVEHVGGHDKHEGHSPEMFGDRLLVSLLLTVPIFPVPGSQFAVIWPDEASTKRMMSG